MRLAQESAKLFHELGAPLFESVGYMFLATTANGWQQLQERAEVQRSFGVPVEEVDASRFEGLRTDECAGAVACWEDGVAEPGDVTAELVRRAADLGVDVRASRPSTRATTRTTSSWSLAEPRPRSSFRSCRSLRSAGSSSTWSRRRASAGPAHDDRGRDDVPLPPPQHAAPRHDGARPAVDQVMRSSTMPSSPTGALGSGIASSPLRVRRLSASAGLYDMTPDAHPLIGWAAGVYVASGFSGHGFHAVAGGGSCSCARAARARAAARSRPPYRWTLCGRGDLRRHLFSFEASVGMAGSYA